MNYKLIMLPNPILVSERLIPDVAQFVPHYQTQDKTFMMIIAGIEGLPKLDLSDIAEEIGWIDVEKLVEQEYEKHPNNDFLYGQSKDLQSAYKAGVWDGLKAAQSLNEKKFSEEDVIEFAKYYEGYSRMISEQKWENAKASVKQFLQMWLLKRKPKEYNVECIQEGNTIKVTKILS